MAEIGVDALAGESGYTTLERRSARPTLDVNGIWGGFTGDGPKTIIPAHAHAKVSCRLVADQDPARVFARLRDHLVAIAPPGVRVTVRDLGMGRGTLTPIDHPATRAAARAIEATFGVAPLYFREGGSIPVAASFERILGQPVVLLGFMNPDARAHAPNENMVLANFETGLRALVRMLDELASYPGG
jgi:acetylornithine deacetylase/succinyl-diaminopimelate desuccinylase-like protein